MPAALTNSPSAERNKGPILEVLRGLLPAAGRVLEIASGTGQHVVHFAAAFPGLVWQPSELDATRRALVAARVADSALANVRAPVALDVLTEPWPVEPALDAVLAINLIHIAPWLVAAALVAGAARRLKDSRTALLVLYGPYKEGGQHSAPSNEAFDQKLRADDPAWGVRNLEEVSALAAAQGFGLPRITRMPANNLTVAYALERRPGA
jgi:SAM-dependent methyltransferase